MKLNLKRSLLTVLLVCGAFQMVWADGWKLTNTTVYGSGGYWENGQKSRIDCSYKGGTFRYERKTTVGKNMEVYSATAQFSEPMKNYAPGENISVRIAFTQKGEKQGYSPYARVTVMSQNPNWTKGKGASNKIPASGTVDGQAVDASGRNSVTPSETQTLSAKTPTNGAQMAIVYSCNGMDVVYLYDWDGEVVVSNQEYAQASTPEPEQSIVEEETVVAQETPEEQTSSESNAYEPSESEGNSSETYQEETETPEMSESYEERESYNEETEMYEDKGGNGYEEEEENEEEEYEEEDEEGGFPLVKLLIVVGVAILLIAVVLIFFRKKKTPAEAEAMAPNQDSYQEPYQAPYQQPQQQPYQEPQQQPYYEESPAQAPYVEEQLAQQSSPTFCPNCGAPLNAGEKFCQECGQRID